MIGYKKIGVAALVALTFTVGSALGAEWERTSGVFAQIETISTSDGVKVLAYTNYATSASDTEGDYIYLRWWGRNNGRGYDVEARMRVCRCGRRQVL